MRLAAVLLCLFAVAFVPAHAAAAAAGADKDVFTMLLSAGKFQEQTKDVYKKKRATYDADKDGKISADELTAWLEAEPAFFKNWPTPFKLLDANGDGTISKDEVAAARKKYDEAHPAAAK